jgi:hypothetical protein
MMMEVSDHVTMRVSSVKGSNRRSSRRKRILAALTTGTQRFLRIAVHSPVRNMRSARPRSMIVQ